MRRWICVCRSMDCRKAKGNLQGIIPLHSVTLADTLLGYLQKSMLKDGKQEYDRKTCVDLMQEACRDAGPIVFITAAGGALGAVINATGAAKMMADAIVAAGVPGILVPIIIGVIMRFPQGSGTTAMITGSAIIAPMISTLNINPYLAALSLCLTTMCPSYLNDSYFHVVTNFSGMDIKTSLKTWTIGSILVPAFGSAIFCILSIFIH